ncbi:MAG TPA: type 1 glutamine amidotransferase [Caulobacteraceae bacterium]|nr:type 1 glutamine amidotransferase [Caulobacteraceae bacterium]
MRIGILAAGRPPRALIPEHGDYVAMFERLLAGRGYDFAAYDVPAGAYPDQPEDCDGYLVTGAAAGVYDSDAWIAELLRFLRAAKGRAKLVGICFGHQAMAQAFGGQVMKSPKGWGIGLHTYGVAAHRPWMDGGAAFSLSASHQDQVVERPADASVVAGNDFCPNGTLAYADGMSISCQLHPEFTADYSIALIDGRRGSRFPDEQAVAAIESLKAPDDHDRFAGWIARFLQG